MLRNPGFLLRSNASALRKLGLPRMLFASKVSMDQIKELRSRSSAPIGDCKKALEATEGDMGEAFDWLRKRGAAKASDLGERDANEGLVAVISNDFEASMLQVGCETDFSQRNSTFQEFVTSATQACFSHAPTPPSSGVHSVTLEALLNVKMVKGEQAEGQPTLSVGDELAELVGKIRENISVRKASKAVAMSGCVGTYVHGAVSAGVGTSAGVVALGVVEEKKSDDAEDASSVVEVSEEMLAVLRPVAKKLAMHVVAAKPSFVDELAIPDQLMEREKAVYRDQAAATGKPDNIVEKMTEGRMKKFYQDHTLAHQTHMIEGDGATVAKVLAGYAKELGVAKITVEGFAVYTTGSK